MIMSMQSIVVEYSVNSKQFFYDTLENTIKRNLVAIKENFSNDYKIVGLCRDIDEALNYIRNIKKELSKDCK